jgi:hypothetical protein
MIRARLASYLVKSNSAGHRQAPPGNRPIALILDGEVAIFDEQPSKGGALRTQDAARLTWWCGAERRRLLGKGRMAGAVPGR